MKRFQTDKFKVGFWRGHGSDNDQYPDVKDYVDYSWDKSEKRQVLSHVTSGKEGRRQRGSSKCRICGESNGSTDITDGVYVWPSGFAHYITAHGVKPPQNFISHCATLRHITEL